MITLWKLGSPGIDAVEPAFKRFQALLDLTRFPASPGRPVEIPSQTPLFGIPVHGSEKSGAVVTPDAQTPSLLR